ncbi:hypothetical protein [Paraglaciecola sp. L3A3]|uniref:hypothetical protein n=1 Tax=Paraglaciecola sp. L3A3 TaxID=2686358 RepID=UPI00131DE62D|nr:hypothetical protein [Paraglaciecola sp. L3A3]
MHFIVTTLDDISCITFQGELNALDMIFMIQSPEYQQAIKLNRKLLIDYSDIDGSNLTEEDIIGITMLGKKTLSTLGPTHIAVVVEDTQNTEIEKISSMIFADSDSRVDVTNDKREALKILQLGL